MIKREFLITVGMVWPVSSDKWKVTLVRVALLKKKDREIFSLMAVLGALCHNADYSALANWECRFVRIP